MVSLIKNFLIQKQKCCFNLVMFVLNYQNLTKFNLNIISLKIKLIKQDSTFNWKSIYFSILLLMVLFFLNTTHCLIHNSKLINFNTINFNNSQINSSSSINLRDTLYQNRYSILDFNKSKLIKSKNFFVNNQLLNRKNQFNFLNQNFIRNSIKQISFQESLSNKTTNSQLILRSLDNQNFNESIFIKTNFNETNFNETNFNETNFSEFYKTNNSETNFSKSNFSKSNFSKFNFSKSNFSKLNINNPIFNNFTFNYLNSTKKNINKRFADEQTFLDLENSSKFNQQKFHKMQKMHHYEQQFHSLKQRLNLPSNLTNIFLLNRPFKSSLIQRSNSPNGLTSIIFGPSSLNANLIANNIIDDVEILPIEDQERYFTMDKFCLICYCNDKKKDTLKCIKNNQLSFIPILPKTERLNIVEIILLNQENLVELNKDQLKYYPNVTKITIQHSALRHIAPNTFKNTPSLKEIDLKHNQIKQLSWKLFDDLALEELTINDNPIPCNCSSKWIQLLMLRKNPEILGPLWDNVSCIDYANKVKPLLNVTIKGCEMPIVSINPSFIEINETEKFSLNCEATGSPLPNVFWNTSDLKSNFTEFLIKPNNNNSVIFNNGNNYSNSSFNNTGISKKNIKPTIKVLEILSAIGTDNGQISCYAENIVGKGKAISFLKINSAPKIEYLEVRKKFYWCISYRITGIPTANRTWYYNKELLQFNENVQDYVLNSNSYAVEGCLQLKKETHAYNGNYTLQVQNDFGETNKSVAAILPNPLPEPSIRSNDQPRGNQYENQNKENYFNFIIFSSFLLVCLIGFVAFIFILGCNTESKTRNNTNNSEKKLATQEKLPLNLSRFVENPNYLAEKQQLLKNLGIRHIESKRIGLIKKLGEGAFGRVYLGTVKDLENEKLLTQVKNDQTFVAVKVLKHTPEQLNTEFEREAELLSNLSHENIVTFFGISVDQHPFMMIFEYMKLGDLNTFLRNYNLQSSLDYVYRKNSTLYNPNKKMFKNSISINNNIDKSITFNNNDQSKIYLLKQIEEQVDEDAKESDHLLMNSQSYKICLADRSEDKISDSIDNNLISNKLLIDEYNFLDLNDLLKISIQICNGMKYLAEQHFVHRDLATRNCLLTNGLIVKIGDFGMSRDIYSTDYYKVGETTFLPVRWMPPESIMFRKFTIESDIWSFGVCLWEIFTLGKQPFFELTNIEVINKVINGKQLSKPENCPIEIYELIMKCCQYNPQDRISMADLYVELKNFHKNYNEKTK